MNTSSRSNTEIEFVSQGEHGRTYGTALTVLLVLSVLVNTLLIIAVGLLVRSLRKTKEGTVKSPLTVLRRAVSRTDKGEANPTAMKKDPDEERPIIKNQTKHNNDANGQINA